MMLARGDVVVAAMPGDYGKPRPCLVIQSDLFSDLPSVTLCLLTSDIQDSAPLLRLKVEPDDENGLRQTSQISIDKIVPLPTSRIAAKIGVMSDVVMLQVSRSLAVFLGIA